MWKKLERKTALLVAVVLIFTFVLSGCDPEQVLQDIATNFIEVNFENPSGMLLAESDDNEQVYTYSIKVGVTNNYIVPMVNAEIKLNAPDNVEITDLGDDAVINEALVEQGVEKVYEWVVKIPMTNSDQNLEYNVSVESEVSSIVESFGMLYVPGMNPEDKRLDFATDTWRFMNYGKTPLPLTQEDYDALMIGMSNNDKQCLKSIIADGTGGHCYGMAVTSVLAKLGRIDPADYGDDVSSLHDLKKNEKAQSLIAYYWITQFFNLISDDITNFSNLSLTDRLTAIENKAKNVENGINPFVILFYTEANNSAPHAIVGYSHESGSFKWGDSTYDSRILTYDSNYPKWNKKSCIYYNTGTDDWYIPNYPDSSDIYGAISDVYRLDVKNIDMAKKSVNSYIRARENEQLTIHYEEGNVAGCVNGAKVVSGENISVFRPAGSDYLTIAVMPESETETEKPALTVKPTVSGEAVDLDITYDDFYLEASSQGAEGVTFNPEGSVEIAGNATDFEIEVTANEGCYVTDWYKVSVTGDSGNNPKIAVDDKGYLLSGDNMDGIKVRAENESSAKELKVKTDEDSVLIAQQGDKLCAMTDSDNDGVYETVIAKGKDADLDGSGGAGINWTLILIIVGAVLALAIIVVAVILIVKKVKNRKPKSTSSSDDINKSDNNGMFL